MLCTYVKQKTCLLYFFEFIQVNDFQDTCNQQAILADKELELDCHIMECL